MQEQIHDILQSLPYKLILSKAKNCEYRKVQILKKEKNYQIEKYTICCRNLVHIFSG